MRNRKEFGSWNAEGGIEKNWEWGSGNRKEWGRRNAEMRSRNRKEFGSWNAECGIERNWEGGSRKMECGRMER
jgi:hypothetical protein